jgi:hypothetical protein
VTGLWLTFEDRRGASVMRPLERSEVARVLRTLRRPATLTLDGETVGGIEEAPDGADDRRVRWQWWYDRSVVAGVGK